MILFLQKLALLFLQECGELPDSIIIPQSAYLRLVTEINELPLKREVKERLFSFQEKGVILNNNGGTWLVRYV